MRGLTETGSVVISLPMCRGSTLRGLRVCVVEYSPHIAMQGVVQKAAAWPCSGDPCARFPKLMPDLLSLSRSFVASISGAAARDESGGSDCTFHVERTMVSPGPVGLSG